MAHTAGRPVPGSRGAVAPRRAAGGREAAARGLPCAWPLVPAQPRPAVCPGPVSSRRAQLRSPPPRPVAGRAPSVSLCLPSSVPGASAVLCRRPSETRPRRALRHPGGAATLPGPCSCSRPPRVLPPGGPPLGGADTQRLPRLAAGAEPPSPPPGRSPQRPPAAPPAAPPPLVLAAHSFAPLLLPGPSPWSAQSALPRGLNA